MSCLSYIRTLVHFSSVACTTFLALLVFLQPLDLFLYNATKMTKVVVFYKNISFSIGNLPGILLKPFGLYIHNCTVFNYSCAYLGTLLHSTVPLHPITVVTLIEPQDHWGNVAVPWYQLSFVPVLVLMFAVLVLVGVAYCLCRMRVRSGYRCMLCE